MLGRTHTVAFEGIEVLKVGTEVRIMDGLPAFSIVGLADKAVAESKERIRAALTAVGLSLPAARITVNLAPADLIKEGTHYDLPITAALLAAMGILAPTVIEDWMMLGELGLDGSIRSVSGVLPAAIAAYQHNMGLVCPATQGSEAAWSGNEKIIAPNSLISLINHFKGTQLLQAPQTKPLPEPTTTLDFADIKGQETAKRAMEIAAAGGHNILMVGPPGSGKSMLASRLPSIMPPMTMREILDISNIHSVAGLLKDGQLISTRPFRDPHHSASTPALVGGGLRARPGEISLAHGGILFLDELPEFARTTLEALRQPLETGKVSVARANVHVTYPARFQLVAAMNPCRCGYLGIRGHECSRAPRCAEEYQSKISGPLLDRIDLHVDVPAVAPWELGQGGGESSSIIRARVEQAIKFGAHRFQNLPFNKNAQADGAVLEQIAQMDASAKTLLINAAEKLMLSARGYHRIMRVARTIADLGQSEHIREIHVAEALSFRKPLRHKES